MKKYKLSIANIPPSNQSQSSRVHHYIPTTGITLQAIGNPSNIITTVQGMKKNKRWEGTLKEENINSTGKRTKISRRTTSYQIVGSTQWTCDQAKTTLPHLSTHSTRKTPTCTRTRAIKNTASRKTSLLSQTTSSKWTCIRRWTNPSTWRINRRRAT